MAKTSVMMSGNTFIRAITLLRRIVEDHTIREEGQPSRCSVCGSALRPSRAIHSDLHCFCIPMDGKSCWVGETVFVLETMIGEQE